MCHPRIRKLSNWTTPSKKRARSTYGRWWNKNNTTQYNSVHLFRLHQAEKVLCITHFQVFNFFKVLTSVWLFLKYWNSDLPTHRFILYYISVPLMVCSLTKTICTAFSIFALTQSTVRFLYVDVFYINIFRELVSTTFWTYLLVLIFSPYYFSLSTRVNLAFLAVIFVSLIVQSVLVITYTCSVYFRYETWLGSLWQLFVCQYGHCQKQESRKHIHTFSSGHNDFRVFCPNFGLFGS